MERLIRPSLLVLFLFCNINVKANADAMTDIRARLQAHDLVRADFVQTRTMKDLERPLVSRGRLVVWGPGGVIWQTEQPFRATYVLRDDSTIEIAADGAARIGRVLRAVLKGDAKALEEWFEAEPRVSGGRWSLALSPRQGPMAFFVKSVQLSGGEFVDSVRIVEETGDATHMQFRNHHGGGALSDEERRLLAGE